MDLTRKLAELDDLHSRGALTEAEFAAAKARLIAGRSAPGGAEYDAASLGRAANRYVTFTIAVSIIGLVAFLAVAGSLLRGDRAPTVRVDRQAFTLPIDVPVGVPPRPR